MAGRPDATVLPDWQPANPIVNAPMSYDETQTDDGADSGSVLRLVTLGLGGLEIILAALAANLLIVSAAPGQEAIEISHALALLVPVIVFTLPGLLLAWLERAPRTALALVLLAAPAALALL